jgi:hypothetical protein
MIPLIVMAVAASLFLVFLMGQMYWRHSGRIERQPARQLIPIDLDAFENLTDPEEERFLRVNLTPADFREVQRDRVRAAKLYVAALSSNAGILAAVGQSARHHADPAIAAAGLEIVQRAVKVKVWCAFALLRLNAALAFPARVSSSSRIASRYMAVKYMATNLPRNVVA